MNGDNATGNAGRDTSGDWVRVHRGGCRCNQRTIDYTNSTSTIRRITDGEIQLSEDVWATARELVALLLKKHKDYGPTNIGDAPGGPLNGLRVRMFDKIARINHLVDNDASPENESLEDSFKDLANYAIIALLVQRGQWPK